MIGLIFTRDYVLFRDLRKFEERTDKDLSKRPFGIDYMGSKSVNVKDWGKNKDTFFQFLFEELNSLEPNNREMNAKKLIFNSKGESKSVIDLLNTFLHNMLDSTIDEGLRRIDVLKPTYFISSNPPLSPGAISFIHEFARSTNFENVVQIKFDEILALVAPENAVSRYLHCHVGSYSTEIYEFHRDKVSYPISKTNDEIKVRKVSITQMEAKNGPWELSQETIDSFLTKSIENELFAQKIEEIPERLFQKFVTVLKSKCQVEFSNDTNRDSITEDFVISEFHTSANPETVKLETANSNKKTISVTITRNEYNRINKIILDRWIKRTFSYNLLSQSDMVKNYKGLISVYFTFESNMESMSLDVDVNVNVSKFKTIKLQLMLEKIGRLSDGMYSWYIHNFGKKEPREENINRVPLTFDYFTKAKFPFYIGTKLEVTSEFGSYFHSLMPTKKDKPEQKLWSFGLTFPSLAAYEFKLFEGKSFNPSKNQLIFEKSTNQTFQGKSTVNLVPFSDFCFHLAVDSIEQPENARKIEEYIHFIPSKWRVPAKPADKNDRAALPSETNSEENEIQQELDIKLNLCLALLKKRHYEKLHREDANKEEKLEQMMKHISKGEVIESTVFTSLEKKVTAVKELVHSCMVFGALHSDSLAIVKQFE